jgi:hypothetical protein
MDLLESPSAGISDQLLLDKLYVLSQLFQDDEIVIDNRIDERISQKICPHLSQAALSRPDSLSHQVEHVAHALLERDNKV